MIKKKKRGQGEGTIAKRSDGTWWGRITVGVDGKGRQKRKAFYGKTRSEVQKKMIAAQSEINSGVYVEASKMTLGQWLDIWLADYKRNSVKVTTYLRYRINAQKHIKPAIGHVKLQSLRVDTIQNFINELVKGGLAPRSVRGVYNNIHAALEQAVDNGLITKNIAIKTLLPKVEKKAVQVLSSEEQSRFVEVAKDAYMGELFIVALGTGLRKGELLALKWDDIDFKEGVLRVNHTLISIKDYDDPRSKWHKALGTPKTKSSVRSIPLLPSVATLLKGVRRFQLGMRLKLGTAYSSNGLVFANQLGDPLDSTTIYRTFTRILKKAGIEKSLHFHCLRHTFATRGLESGIELRVMQELLGHSSISMTADLYTHVLPDKKKDSIMKLEGTLVF